MRTLNVILEFSWNVRPLRRGCDYEVPAVLVVDSSANLLVQIEMCPAFRFSRAQSMAIVIPFNARSIPVDVSKVVCLRQVGTDVEHTSIYSYQLDVAGR